MSLKGKCLKMKPEENGYPDRLCIIPRPCYDPLVIMVELKSEGEEPTPLQIDTHEELRKLGMNVFVVSNVDELEKFKFLVGNILEIYKGDSNGDIC